MKREEAINMLYEIRADNLNLDDAYTKDKYEALGMAIKALEQEPCEDAISRQAVLEWIKGSLEQYANTYSNDMLNMWKLFEEQIKALPPVTAQQKTEECKNCKWWKDSDGIYRRGCRAESKCPINRREVLEGNGYCYMFEPQESENKK